MANFTAVIVGPWLPRRDLLATGGVQALAAQGARLAAQIDRALERGAKEKLDVHPAGDAVRLDFQFIGGDRPGDLVDLVGAVEAYVIDTLVRRGIFARAQIVEIKHGWFSHDLAGDAPRLELYVSETAA